ncbi:hypothetical protein RZS28_09810 [Methylocapsa polymorpha]|uniref:Transposase n=1 Tax=Methylocapsa polymorpha TaxID=3080828 RepID=A0ABZ0HMI3_9HYPH|nr:hypothetical protein RZS28_09810 [Methylocapsa sp. RX1]
MSDKAPAYAPNFAMATAFPIHMHRDSIDEELREIDRPKSIVLEHAPIENVNRLFLKRRFQLAAPALSKP